MGNVIQISQHILHSIGEGLLFLFITIILFNSLTDFATKFNLISGTLTMTQLQYFGVVSSLFAALNVLSKKFFGFEIIR